MKKEVEHSFDCIVVGQGIAGSCHAYSLIKHGLSVLVIDAHAGEHCSAVAAGTMNPIAIRTFTPIWKADELFPLAKSFYSELAQFLQVELLNERKIFKVFSNESQKELWLKKSDDTALSPYLNGHIEAQLPHIQSEHSLGQIQGAGNINMKELLQSFRTYLKGQDCLLEEELDYNKLEIGNDVIHYGNLTSKRLVFCEGSEAVNNPFFSDLPFKRTKGELLVIKSAEYKNEDIVNNRINMVPLGDDLYWVGATYEWNDMSLDQTDGAKEKLLNQLKNTLKSEFQVVDHKVGIRPTVKDRRPILGRSLDYPNLYILNGLGTRGVVLAPWCSLQLAEHMLNGKDLDPEVDLKRFSEST